MSTNNCKVLKGTVLLKEGVFGNTSVISILPNANDEGQLMRIVVDNKTIIEEAKNEIKICNCECHKTSAFAC